MLLDVLSVRECSAEAPRHVACLPARLPSRRQGHLPPICLHPLVSSRCSGASTELPAASPAEKRLEQGRGAVEAAAAALGGPRGLVISDDLPSGHAEHAARLAAVGSPSGVGAAHEGEGGQAAAGGEDFFGEVLGGGAGTGLGEEGEREEERLRREGQER